MLFLHTRTDFHQAPNLPRLLKGLEFAFTAQASLPDGDIALEGKDVYAKIMTLETQAREKRFYETHRDYLDIHRVLTGEQFIEWLPRGVFPEAPYDAAKDVIKYGVYPDGSLLRMQGTAMAVFFPEDAHRPQIAIAAPGKIKVCVVKVRLG